MKKLIIAAALMLALPAAAHAEWAMGKWIKTKDIVGKDGYEYTGPDDGTVVELRKYVYLTTGVKLGPCVEHGKRQYGFPGNATKYPRVYKRKMMCIAWTVVGKPGTIARLPED